jgi:outer membrane protein assembly factor BamB
MGGIFTPFGADPVLICPGANGGSEWSPASYSPQTELMYVCGIHQPQIWTFKPDQLEPGTLRLGSAFITPPGGKTSGTFTAIDVKTNKIAWQAEWEHMCIGGSLATAGGLVFAGEANGNFDAYDAKTGDLLWQFQTGAGVNAPAVTYESSRSTGRWVRPKRRRRRARRSRPARFPSTTSTSSTSASNRA